MFYDTVKHFLKGESMQKLLISFTSYPARIKTVYKVVESLWKQRQRADEIVLWLSTEDFPKQWDDLPKSLKSINGQNGFRVEWVNENLKSHKKYLYSLQNRDQIVITVDDDTYYDDMMVSTLMESYRKHPYAVSARNVHIITRQGEKLSPYEGWAQSATEFIGVERMDLCAIGVNGILYPPYCGNERWFNREQIKKFAPNQDDLWLKFHEIIDGIPTVYTGMEGQDQVIEGSQESALYTENGKGGANDSCILGLLDELKNNDRNIYEKWFSGLLQQSELIQLKRKYYELEFEKIFIAQIRKDLYVCGAGNYARLIIDFIESYRETNEIKAFLVTRRIENQEKSETIRIKEISELDQSVPCAVICGVGKNYRHEMKQSLNAYKLCEWIDVDVQGIARLFQMEQSQGI